jgi:hypothetical protein
VELRLEAEKVIKMVKEIQRWKNNIFSSKRLNVRRKYV